MYYSGDNLEFKNTSEIKPTLEEELRGNMGEPVTFPKPIQKPGQALPKPRHSFLRGRLKKLFMLQAVAATVGVSALLTGYGIDFLGDLFPPVVPGQTEETTAEETTGDETPGGVTDEETTSPETEGTSSSEETTDPDETTAPEDTAPDHVHVFGQQNTTVEPTCTEAGEAERVCSECGFVEKVPLEALGHDVINDPAEAASCTEAGLSAGSHCARCGEVFHAQTVIEALGHDFGEWTVVNAATCIDDGSEEHTCSRCGVIESQTVAATGHTVVTDQAVAATCTDTGLTAGSHCSVCGTVLTAQTQVQALGHTFGALTTVTAATCTTDGSGTHTCTRCGTTETQTIAATGHTVVTDQAVAATCTEPGLSAGTHCSVCGTVLTAQTRLQALGHNFGAWTTVTAATCTTAGSERHTCSRCSETETRTVAATGHTSTTVPAVAATCTEDGFTSYTVCSVCGVTLTQGRVIPATGHSYDSVTGICSSCGSSVLSYYYYEDYDHMYAPDQSILPGTLIALNDEDHPFEITVGDEAIFRLEFDGLEADDWFLVEAEVEWGNEANGPPLGIEYSESKFLYLYPDEVLPGEAESLDLCVLLMVSGDNNRYSGIRFYVRIIGH